MRERWSARRLGLWVLAASVTTAALWGCTTLLGDVPPGLLGADAGSDGSLPPARDGGSTLDAGPGDAGPMPVEAAPPADAAPDVTACTPGLACAAGACAVGQTACDGGSYCAQTSVVPNGTTCDAGAVCDNGACAACATGADCTPSGSCQRKTINCTSGTSVCTAAGTVPDGTPCGASLFCNAGMCEACTAGASCVPSANLCHGGTVTCSGGQVVCTDTGTALSNGTSCGSNEVCFNGQCNACTATLTCTPANPCHSGLTSCSSGTTTCVDQGASLSNGTACGNNEVCYSGSCFSCTSGMACTPAASCHSGVTTCTSGQQVCLDTGNAPDGTACGASPLVCYAGTCECAFSGLEAYFAFDNDTTNDTSGNGNNASNTNVVYFNTGGIFNSPYLAFNNQPTITLGGSYTFSGARTLCAWVQTTNLTSGLGLPVFTGGVSASLGQNDNYGILPAAPSGAGVCGLPRYNLYIDHWGTPAGCPSSSVAITPGGTSGTWNYVCYAYNGMNTTMFANGQAVVAPVTAYSWPISTLSLGGNFVGGTSTQRYFVDAMDEVSIWTGALSLAQMNALYNNGNGCKAH